MSRELLSHYAVHRRYFDVDDLAAEAQQWNLDFLQLERGTFDGEILQFGTTDAHISVARFGRMLNQKGCPPLGLRTIAVPADPDLNITWRGKTVDGNSLMVFPKGAELSSVSGRDFHVYTCSFPEEVLATAGDGLNVGGLEELPAGQEAIRVDSTAMDHLRDSLASISRSVRATSNPSEQQAAIERMRETIPIHLTSAIAARYGGCPEAGRSKRRRAVARAEAYIQQHASEKLSIGNLCQAVETSERTLQYAFIEQFGIGPKEYLNAYRLASARRDLRLAEPTETKIADIANAWGFWHMGQFAADYRRRFAELPSETLRR